MNSRYQAEEQLEEFLDLASAAFYQALKQHPNTAKDYLDRMSFNEIAAVERGTDELRQIARGLVGEKGEDMSLLHRTPKPPILYPSATINKDGLKSCDLCPFYTRVWEVMDAHMSVHITGKWNGT